MPSSRKSLREELELLRARIGEVESELARSESLGVDPESSGDGSAADVSAGANAQGVIAPSRPLETLEGCNIGYWEWHVLEDRTFISEQWAGLLGYDARELPPGLHAWQSLVHPEDYPGALWKLESHLRGELELYEAEFRMRTRRGEWHWILSRGRVVARTEDGLPIRMTGVHIDVQRRRHEEELMQQLAQHLGDGIFLASIRPRSLLYANPAFERLLGGDASLWIGQPLRQLLTLVHEDDRRRVRRSFRTALETGRFDEFFRFVRADGEIAHVHVRCFPIYDGGGELVRLSGSVQDVTELIHARRDKASLEQQLVHAQRIESIGRLAGGVAHDFNNVLTAILGNVALLKHALHRGTTAGSEAADPDFLLAGLEHIEHASRDAASLTRQLLAFGRRQELEPELVTPEFVLADCERMLERLIRENIELHVLADPSCWFLEADPSSLKQVVLNLAVNASDAMPDGGRLAIEARNVFVDADHEPGGGARVFGHAPVPGPYVRFSIRDTGCGIPEDLLEAIFDPFFTTKEAHVGTGLGLSIVHGIVMQSGGHIVVETECDKGTCFHVLLPALTTEAAEARLAADPERYQTRTDPLRHAPRGRREHILVCEDQAAVLDLTARILEHAGYRVTRTRDASQALDAHTRLGDVALLLSDVILPGVSGTALARRISTQDPGLPVLFMSGYPAEEVRRAGFVEGSVPVLRKPFEPQRLLQLVRELLEKPGSNGLHELSAS